MPAARIKPLLDVICQLISSMHTFLNHRRHDTAVKSHLCFQRIGIVWFLEMVKFTFTKYSGVNRITAKLWHRKIQWFGWIWPFIQYMQSIILRLHKRHQVVWKLNQMSNWAGRIAHLNSIARATNFRRIHSHHWMNYLYLHWSWCRKLWK